MSDFIRFPWAVSGDVATIPATTQPGGDVSIQEGYGEDYSRDLRSDPLAKSVERNKFNWFLNLMTKAARFLQIHGGVPEFISPSDNGGVAFSYGVGVRVRYDDGGGYKTYLSRVASNTELPTNTTNWDVIDDTTGIPDGRIMNDSIAPNAAIEYSKLAPLTNTRALVSDGSGSIVVSAVTATQLGYVAGVTSAIQTQLNAKQATITGGATTIATANLTASRALVSDASGKVAVSAVTATQLGYVAGVTSAIQTQLNGKQASGNYITALTGDVLAAGPGSAAASLSTTGVVAGTYPNAEIQVDAKGRIITAKAGGSPFGMIDDFEIFSGGLPTGLPWTSAQAAQISQSSLYVTNGTKSCNFAAVGAVTMSATVPATQFAQYGEMVVDVYVATMAGGQRATLSCGANSVSTPNGATGAFQLRVQVPPGATTASLAVSGASNVYWDNMRYVTKISATGTSYDNTNSGTTQTNVQGALDEIYSGNQKKITANTGTAYAIDTALGKNQNFYLTLTGNCTFTFTNPTPDVNGFVLFLKQDATGSRTVTWPGSVDWAGGTAPALTGTANSVDVFVFITPDGGTTWVGFMVGADVK